MRNKVFKIITILLILTLLFPIANANAETLGNLKAKLAKEKSAQASANAKKNQTKNEISSDKNSIYQKQNEISSNRAKIEEAKKQIQELNEEIEDTKAKIKKAMLQEELSDGDNAYLEYIFGATSISDFIIRLSISTQLADYNKGLIDGYKDKIEEDEELQAELAQREKDLNEQIAALEAEIEELGNDLTTYTEEAASHAEEVAALEERIKYYTQLGCKDNQEISACLNPSSVISSSGFMRPIGHGTITSEYGWRYHPTLHYSRLHAGIDIGVAEGTPVYPIANGKVTVIFYRSSCGGNQVFVTHNVNGAKYTSVYMHLYSINTSVGSTVTTNTVIAYSGGGSTRAYDACTSGAHLHLGIATGWYCDDSSICYTSYGGWTSHSQNPRNYVNLPSLGSSFYTR